MKTVFNLNKIISKYGIRQIDLARAADISPVTISNYCRGTAYPSIPNLIAMSDNLNIPIDDFFDVVDENSGARKNVIVCPRCHQPLEIYLGVPKSE